MILPAARRCHPSRTAGFTAIELLAVMGIMMLLAGMTLPAALTALSKGSVNHNAETIAALILEAQDLARRATPPRLQPGRPSPHYGLAIVQDGTERHATLLYGLDAQDELLVDGVPAARRLLRPGPLVMVAYGTGLPQPLDGRLAWFFQFGTGRPIAAPDRPQVIDIGTRPQAARPVDYRYGSNADRQTFAPAIPALPGSPICSELSVRSPDDRYRIQIQQFRIGALRVEDL